MDQCKIDQISALSRKSKTCALTEEEQDLQKALREEYLCAMRTSLKNTLENTYIERPDGTKEKLKEKE